MTPAERKHHGYTSGGSMKDPAPEPTHAERARTLLLQAREGTLATQSRRHPGFPFASLMPYALDHAGRPVVLVSALAIHTQNLQHDDRVSLLVTEPDLGGRNPLGLARVTLLGRLREVSGEDRVGESTEESSPAGGEPTEAPGEARELYLARHPEARYWADYPDFGFRRMEVEEVYYVGGFGVMGWVGGDDYRHADPDPLRDAARSIIDHMNEDHTEALLILARCEGIEGAEEVRMTSVDRLGYHLRVRTDQGMRGLRIAFPTEAREPARVRELLVAQVKKARTELGGR